FINADKVVEHCTKVGKLFTANYDI
ncbi:unnamed protein product, partial [Rotaria sp. Silwood1]